MNLYSDFWLSPTQSFKNHLFSYTKSWKEVPEDGRKKAKCAGNGSVREWEERKPNVRPSETFLEKRFTKN